MRSVSASLALSLATMAPAASARDVSIDEALRLAHHVSPDLVIARGQEAVAHAEVGIAGVYPNPGVAIGTSTQAAALSGTLSIPLVILGQRGAAIQAAQADEATVALDTQVTWNDVKRGTEHSFAALWLAEGVAVARHSSASIAARLEAVVVQRVAIGSAPQLDAQQLHAEKLRADAEVLEAEASVIAAASELGRWMGMDDGESLRTQGGLGGPSTTPPLADLLARVDSSAAVRREESDVRAAEARLDRERALVRPQMSLDIGFDAWDPTLAMPPGSAPPINYRGQLAFEVPIFNQRTPYIERERAQGNLARGRAQAARIRQAAGLTASFRKFEAASARQSAMVDAVVPAAEEAAKATEEAYSLGRAQLVAVLGAERTLVDVRVAAFEAQAARAVAWADVEHALGAP